MSWRNQGITGSNNIPLGKSRRFGGDGDFKDEDDHVRSAPSVDGPDRDLKRGRSPEPRTDADGPRRRKKRNRWGEASENKAAGLMGLPTAIVANMTSEQLEAYTLHLRIEEISQKLKIDDVVPADGDRSPSPAPMYDNHGRRVNTREYRYRKRLEDERHKLIEKAMKTIPNYHPPQDYRRPTKTQEKVYVPVNDYPEINFIGLLIGPRGNTLKKMETESGAKIAIRGKGSVKEGKGRSDAAHASNQEEDLHCLIMADTEEKVNKAKKLIHNVIETAASIPEGQNELKRNQLRELAALNGTLRDDENQACQNCGQIGHRKYDCPEKQNYTASIICHNVARTGGTMDLVVDRRRDASVGERPTLITSNSWQSLEAARRLHASRPGLGRTLMEMPSRGSEAPQEVLPPGVTATKIAITMMVVTVATAVIVVIVATVVTAVVGLAAVLHPGLVTAASGITTTTVVTAAITVAITIITTTTITTAKVMEALLLLARHPGIRLLRLPPVLSLTGATRADIQDSRRWVPLLGSERPLRLLLTT
ncbi:hypothetical protein M406DRAFT_326345 [Cryphonectria parasitica EP155]|uniref:Branchpoint-bridging protein n=1 Tax=Cryphonectria parasitica (strain ATCC 38755 / EP155) TaxID=660469 RepID=A0A9P4YD80_CRYP1|nr:uncharacterized protein M406DRAFT_326345 [Cryphonectria parasitica EP155]KAF3770933.1 hypothetical protein M406DRAFT_326345 [Cryphonectria parasitica EP155]